MLDIKTISKTHECRSQTVDSLRDVGQNKKKHIVKKARRADRTQTGRGA